MTKAELLNKMFEMYPADVPAKSVVENTLQVFCDVMAAELLAGGDVPLPGLGKLKAKPTPARKARNPKTGEPIDVPAGMRVLFVPSRELKNALKK